MNGPDELVAKYGQVFRVRFEHVSSYFSQILHKRVRRKEVWRVKRGEYYCPRLVLEDLHHRILQDDVRVMLLEEWTRDERGRVFVTRPSGDFSSLFSGTGRLTGGEKPVDTGSTPSRESQGSHGTRELRQLAEGYQLMYQLFDLVQNEGMELPEAFQETVSALGADGRALSEQIEQWHELSTRILGGRA